MEAMTLRVELGEQTLRVLAAAFAEALGKFQPVPVPVPESKKVKGIDQEWLTMRQFCQKFDIGATTVKRRVKDGMVLKSNCGGRTPRYRWAEGYGDRREL